tara:strand:- start:4140 stop:4970 length:831 start_codon:yes stop_codon:yes gene_type:complete
LIKIGITGSTGILGQNLSKLLRRSKKFKLIHYRKNILSKNDVQNWIKNNQFQIIIHLAALVPTQKALSNYNVSKKINFEGTKLLVDSINKYQIKNTYFFFSSTSHVYSYSNKKLHENSKLKGISKYGKIKILAEKYIKENNQKYTYCIGRISSLVSEFQKDSFLLINLIKKGKQKKNIFIENSNIKRNFIYVKDVSNIIIKIIKKKIKGILNISSNEEISMVYIIQLLKKEYNFKITYKNKHKKHLLLSNKLLCKKIGKFKFTSINSVIKKIYKNL